jgi:hypothetical protein
VSPFRPFLLPQLRVFSQPPFALQPNFYAFRASSFLSITCRLFASLCSLFRARLLCFQQVTASFCKMPGGVGYLSRTSAPGACPDPVGASLYPESRRARDPLPLFLSPRCRSGVWRPRFAHHSPLVYPDLRGVTRHFLPSTFRINTCKSVSKQTTLIPFRINTCEKTGGGRGGTG